MVWFDIDMNCVKKIEGPVDKIQDLHAGKIIELNQKVNCSFTAKFLFSSGR